MLRAILIAFALGVFAGQCLMLASIDARELDRAKLQALVNEASR